MKRRMISAVVAGVFIVTIAPSTVQVSATPSNQQVEESRSKYEELKAKINETSEKIRSFDNQISELAIKIENNNKNIDNINKEVENTNKEINQVKEDASKKEEMLGKRLREIYKSGREANYVSLICSATGLSDLVTKVKTAVKLIDTDKKFVKGLSDNKSKLDEKVKSLGEKVGEIKKLNSDIELQKNQLNIKKVEEQSIVDQAKLEEEDFVKQYLIPMEREVAQGFIDVVNNESSSNDELSSAISALEAIVGQTKSDEVKSEINNAIEKAKNSISNKKSSVEVSRSQVWEYRPSVISKDASAILDFAYKFIGKPYAIGATGPDSFDCSGFTSYVYRTVAGIDIGRTTYDQINAGREVSENELQPGDLVFPSDGHVTIYIGKGQVIHSPQTGDHVKVSSMWRFWRARRVLS